MTYTSYTDMADAIRRNAWKVPYDVDLIVGVPRSGMIPALMLAELLNKRCTDLDAFLIGHVMSCGNRGRFLHRGKENKVLVLDDTVFYGKAMKCAREKLKPLMGSYDFIFGCIYAEGRDAKKMVDIYFEDIYRDGESRWFYEWNVLHHYGGNTNSFIFDIDGLLCKDPPDERNKEAYEAYLPQALPMIIPTTPIGALVTYRLEKYRPVTERWLREYGITYGNLMMFNAANYETRNAIESPSSYKARIYTNANWATLFVESNAKQAGQIFQMTGKPVLCYENGRIYK